MRHTFYINNRKKNGGRGSGVKYLGCKSCYPSSVSKAGGVIETKDKKLMFVEAKVRAALKANESNQDMRTEIIGKLSMYRANIIIAREFHDKNAEKALTKNFINYLNKKSNEKR